MRIYPLILALLGPLPPAFGAPPAEPEAQAAGPVALITDRPRYRPGDTIQLRTWGGTGLPLLIDGWDRIVTRAGGPEGSAIYLPQDFASGHYRLRLPAGARTVERTIVVDAAPPTLETERPETRDAPAGPPSLAVRLTPSPGPYAPGDTVSIDITVTDSAGQPVSGRFAIAVIDEAIAGPVGDHHLDLARQLARPARAASGKARGPSPPPGAPPIPADVPYVGTERRAGLPDAPPPPARDRLLRQMVFFPAGATAVPSRADPVLDEVAATLRGHPDVLRVELEGHSDHRGAPAANLRASQARAEAVRAALIERGVTPERLVARGFGDAMPIHPEDSAQNRRVEFNAFRYPPSRARARPPIAPDPRVLWQPRTPVSAGEARLRFALPERPTRVVITVVGMVDGAVGHGQVRLQTTPQIELDAPAAVHVGDRFTVPIVIAGAAPTTLRWRWGNVSGERALGPTSEGRYRAAIELEAVDAGETPLQITLEGDAGPIATRRSIRVISRRWRQTIRRSLPIEPDGEATFDLPLPQAPIDPEVKLRIWSVDQSKLSMMRRSLLGGSDHHFYRKASGFSTGPRATKSTAERNALHLRAAGLALRHFERHARSLEGHDDIALGHARRAVERARKLIGLGHGFVAAHRHETGGFGTIIGQKPDPRATALAIIALHETGGDAQLIAEAAAWLDANREPREMPNAMPRARALVDRALAIGGRQPDLRPYTAETRGRPYLIGQRILTLLDLDRRAEAQALGEQLLKLVETDRRWANTWPDKPNAGRGGHWPRGLRFEATALAVRALAALDMAPALRRRALGRLMGDNSDTHHRFGERSVELAAALLTESSPVGPSATGEIVVRVDGEPLRRITQPEIGRGQLEFTLPAEYSRGMRALRVSQRGSGNLSWHIDGAWFSEQFPGRERPPLRISTALKPSRLSVGQRATLTVTARATARVPLPVLRIGLPAGLAPDLDQLRDWTARGTVALAEARPGEVVLYLDALARGEERRFALDMRARYPGTFKAPASSLYRYANPDAAWAPPLAVEVR